MLLHKVANCHWQWNTHSREAMLYNSDRTRGRLHLPSPAVFPDGWQTVTSARDRPVDDLLDSV